MRYNYDESAAKKWRSLAFGLVASAIGVCTFGCAARAATPDDVQYSVTATIPSGSTEANNYITVPAGKLLVITSISYYRQNAPSNSIGQLFVATTAGGKSGYTGLPEAKADGALYPDATITTLLYADAGTNVLANAYTNVAPSGPETDIVTLTGYLLPQK